MRMMRMTHRPEESLPLLMEEVLHHILCLNHCNNHDLKEVK